MAQPSSPAPDPVSRSVGPAPSTQRVNPNNVVQTGRSLTMGDAIKYLKRSTQGYVQGFGENWNSAPLPETEAGAQQQLTPLQSGQAGYQMGAQLAGLSGDDSDKFTAGYNMGEYLANNGAESGSLSAALADKSSLKFDRDKYTKSEGFEAPEGTISNEEMARRRAFLDAPDSLSGIKAVKAQNNLFSLGTKDFMVNNGELTEISGESMRDRLAGRMTAEELKDKYVKNITESDNEEE